MELKGKIALVTGAGRGIGEGTALEFARRGADLVLNDRPDSPDIASTAEAVRALGRACVVIEADIFSRGGCEALARKAIDAHGRIDILVSNPAMSVRCEFLSHDPDEFERSVQGTLTSGFHISQLIARHMVARGNGGKIIFISSVHAQIPFANSIAYGAAKAGLNHMTRTIATELSQHRINVNAIEPGWIDTPGERARFGDDVIDRAGEKLPWGRMGTPRDIACAAAFLASDDADYITGTVLTVDGGIRFKDCRAESLTLEK